MKILRYLLISIISVITIFAGGFLYVWLNKGGIKFAIPKISSDLEIKEVNLTRSVAGKTEWELKARSADYFKEKGVTHLESPYVIFFGKGERRFELKSDKGEVFNDTSDMTALGDVRVVTSDGYSFKSDYLRYYSEKKVVTTESRVLIKGKGIEIEGVGMEAYVDRNRVLLKKDVKAILTNGEWVKR